MKSLSLFLSVLFLSFKLVAQESAPAEAPTPTESSTATEETSEKDMKAAEENLEAEASDDPAGKQVMELNKKVRDKREAFYSCRKEKKPPKECEKLGKELSALRAERDAKMKEAPGLRRKIRKQVGADRIKQKREEKGDFGSTEE